MNPLSVLIESLIEEALEEAGPVGYLSKTKRPDSKTAWNPAAQDAWAAQRGGALPPAGPGNEPHSPPKTQGGQTQSNNPGTNMGTIAPKPGELPEPEQTNPGLAATAQKKYTPTIADITALLQRANQDEMRQIYAILDKGNPII